MAMPHVDSCTQPPVLGAGSIAIAHDYLNQRGGAERVVLEMAKLWPDAPIYTSLFRPESTFPEFDGHDVRTSFLDHVPIDGRFRALLPLYPAAFRSLGTIEADVVVSSTTGWAHGVRTQPDAVHVVYCHSPARWLYENRAAYLSMSRRRRLARPLFGPLKRWDQAAAHRAGTYVTNSQHIRDQVRAVYGIEAEVVYPPVQLERFTPLPRGERLLVVSRLLAYKRVELAVMAATAAGIGLDVVGYGPEMPSLREVSGPTVEFHGQVDDATVTEMMERCRALCVPGIEDFGIASVEAQAAGKPVIAFAGGGALETVKDGVSGVLFDEPTPDGFLKAIQAADRLDTDPRTIAAGTQAFSPERFDAAIQAVVVRARSETAKRVAAAV